MRIGLRGAISSLVLASIIVSAAGVHLLWWRTAEQTSQTLATTIDEQIVSAVGDELQSITTEARSAHAAVRTLFQGGVLDPRDAEKRKFVFLSQLQAQPTISWVVFGWPDGSLSAAHKLGDAAVEILEIAKETPSSKPKLRIERYELIDGDLRYKDTRSEDTSYSVIKQEWFEEAMQSVGPRWFNLTSHPGGDRLAVALAGPIDIDQNRQGVLSIAIELTRVSRFLSQLTVGKSAGAFILDRSGAAIASPDPDADEVNVLKTNHPLFPVAVRAVQQSGTSYDPDRGDAHRTRVAQGDQAYEAVLTPISLPGWSLVTIVPESEFLG
ncbi:MAG TPA: cache domain-containing protein, partial [Galbitalea sp.]|nr:cache domain-containing protein [Galbitalea sp.]